MSVHVHGYAVGDEYILAHDPFRFPSLHIQHPNRSPVIVNLRPIDLVHEDIHIYSTEFFRLAREDSVDCGPYAAERHYVDSGCVGNDQAIVVGRVAGVSVVELDASRTGTPGDGD